MLSKANYPGLSRKARRAAAAQAKLIKEGKPIRGFNYAELAITYHAALKNWVVGRLLHRYREPYPGFTALVRAIHNGKAEPGVVVA